MNIDNLKPLRKRMSPHRLKVRAEHIAQRRMNLAQHGRRPVVMNIAEFKNRLQSSFPERPKSFVFGALSRIAGALSRVPNRSKYIPHRGGGMYNPRQTS